MSTPPPEQQIRKPRVKLVPIGSSFRANGGWRQFLGDSKGRVYLRCRRKAWRDVWFLCMTVCDGTYKGVKK